MGVAPNRKRKFRQLAFSIVSAVALSTALTGMPVAADDTIKVDVALEAQALDKALNDLAQQFGKQIALYSADAAGMTAQPLNGTYTEQQAFRALLAGTGLEFRYINDRTIAVATPDRLAMATGDTEFQLAQAGGTSGTSGNGAGPDDGPLDVIVVTVQKREEDLQDVPLAVSAFDGDTLDAFNITSIQDVSRFTPNFLGSSFTNTQPIFAIRGGANTLSAIGTSEPVGVYIDEVYIPRFSSADLELFDLERVEVLRGPQGTFFGRNVASGAVVLTTKKPSFEEAEAKIQGSYGNFDAYQIRALASGPLTDNVAAKISFSRSERDGYGVDRLSGQEQDDMESTSVRGAIRWRPTAPLEITLSADFTNDRNGGRTLSSTSIGDDGDRRTSELGLNQDFERDIYGGSARISYDLNAGSLLSITGVRASQSDELFSFNGLSFSLLPFAFQQVDRDSEDPRTISQELRFVSEPGNRLDYIAGLFYLNENSDRVVERQRFASGSGTVIQDLVFDQNVKTNAFAGYVDGTLHITDQLDLAAGVRYTIEERKATLNFVNNLSPGASFLASGLSETFDAFTPRVSLVYRPTEDITVFGNLSRGFTAGGFNTEADALNEITDPFQEETILSYEIGAKTRFADGRGYGNVTFFRQNYKDKQEFVFNSLNFVGTILNAAEATIQGVEVEGGYRFNDYLGINANYGFLDTDYDSFPIPGGTDNTGNELGSSPSHQFAVSGDGIFPILNGQSELFANASYTFTDSYFTGATNDPDLRVRRYGLLGASFGVQAADGRWKAEVWGSNLLDKDYVLIPSDFIVTAEHLGAPRFYGGRVTLAY